jgi:hypothetical protein
VRFGNANFCFYIYKTCQLSVVVGALVKTTSFDQFVLFFSFVTLTLDLIVAELKKVLLSFSLTDENASL